VFKGKTNVKQCGLAGVTAVAKPLLPTGAGSASTVELLYERVTGFVNICLWK
jgi:hypothetical protein